MCIAKRSPYNLVPCFNLVPCSLEPPAHAFRALEGCRHAGEGLPCCLVTSSGTSSAANGRAGEEYQVRARYQVRANALLGSRSGHLSHRLDPQLSDALADQVCIERRSLIMRVRIQGVDRKQECPGRIYLRGFTEFISGVIRGNFCARLPLPLG